MLKLTGKCCGGKEAIEFMENLLGIIEEEKKTADFYEKYHSSLNRFRYEVAKGIGKPVKINKGIKSWHKDIKVCGECGSTVNEVVWMFCPNCGTKIIHK